MKGLLPRITVHEQVVGADAKDNEDTEKVEDREKVLSAWPGEG